VNTHTYLWPGTTQRNWLHSAIMRPSLRRVLASTVLAVVVGSTVMATVGFPSSISIVCKSSKGKKPVCRATVVANAKAPTEGPSDPVSTRTRRTTPTVTTSAPEQTTGPDQSGSPATLPPPRPRNTTPTTLLPLDPAVLAAYQTRVTEKWVVPAEAAAQEIFVAIPPSASRPGGRTPALEVLTISSKGAAARDKLMRLVRDKYEILSDDAVNRSQPTTRQAIWDLDIYYFIWFDSELTKGLDLAPPGTAVGTLPGYQDTVNRFYATINTVRGLAGLPPRAVGELGGV
jgi:hypothetical protein